MKHKILITGGSGFIGTQVTDELLNHGHEITVVDRKVKTRNHPCPIIEMDYMDFLNTDNSKYDTIVHLAADHTIEQSVTQPEKYYTNNVIKMKYMLDHMVKVGIKNIIFSSTGSVYGTQGINGLLSEETPYAPVSPYSATKVAGELMIRDYARAYGINYVNLRYFNPIGADPTARFGYIQRPATHVIPILCRKIINDETFEIYGSDYPTRDGTCIRDYMHVFDVASAHTSSINYLDAGNKEGTFNIGGHTGVSVRELVAAAERVLDKRARIVYKERRAGDAAMLVADTTKAREILGWQPKYTIDDAILHAWNWENKFEKSN